MLIARDEMKFRTWDNCHDGQGRIHVVELIDKKQREPGFSHVCDMFVEPGASVGEHTHVDDEEIYYILDGEGEMILDGVPQAVRAGDLVYTKKGHRHSLKCGPGRPMRVMVVISNV